MAAAGRPGRKGGPELVLRPTCSTHASQSRKAPTAVERVPGAESAKSVREIARQLRNASNVVRERRDTIEKAPFGVSASWGFSRSRPVSRILSWVAIPLGSYPGPGRVASCGPCSPCTGRGLASRRVAAVAGGLLPHLFTLTSGVSGKETSRRRRFVFCATFRRLSPPGLRQRPTLRCPDFPRAAPEAAARGHPACSSNDSPRSPYRCPMRIQSPVAAGSSEGSSRRSVRAAGHAIVQLAALPRRRRAPRHGWADGQASHGLRAPR